jgi:2-keto-4-pentenoate hydratase
MPGSCTRAVDVGPGDGIEARFAGLGSVTATFV